MFDVCVMDKYNLSGYLFSSIELNHARPFNTNITEIFEEKQKKALKLNFP